MRLLLHDKTPAKPGEKHGTDGPTHAGTVTFDAVYQLEMWVEEIEASHPEIVFAYCPELGRAWERFAGAEKFKEVPWLGILPPWVDFPDPADSRERQNERLMRAIGWT